MKILRSVFFGLVLSFLVSCTIYSTPNITFINNSDKYISKVQFTWNGFTPWAFSKLNPHKEFSQNFYIKHKSDFFGPVHVQWENAAGKKLSKDFIFEEKEIPSPLKKMVWDGVYFEFTQDDVNYYTNYSSNYKKYPRK